MKAAMTPVLYSFRRCPYAMRARLALGATKTRVALREVVLRDKPAAFLTASPSGTVPCLVTRDGVIDESLDIMRWCLAQTEDPHSWLDMPDAGWDWIARCDGPFKHALDRTKYATRYPDENPATHRAEACVFLQGLDAQIGGPVGGHIFDWMTIADAAIAPFVRQFAFIDKPWFDAQPWPNLQAWLARFLASDAFADIMPKMPQWHEGDPVTLFPKV